MLVASWSFGNLVDAVFHVPENPWLVVVKFSLLALCLGMTCGVLAFCVVTWWWRRGERALARRSDSPERAGPKG